MSAAQPYLHKQRKDKLVEFAEISGLNGYEEYNKPDLVTALDAHLQSNRSYVIDPRLSDYYRRLAQPGRFGTPARKVPRVEVSSPVLVEELGTRSTRRRAAARGDSAIKRESSNDEETTSDERKREVTATSEESTDNDDNDNNRVNVSTPGRTPKVADHPVATLPPSPAIVTEAIDRQTTAWNQRLKNTWTASGIKEHTHALRTLLSSVKAIETLALFFEGSGLIREIWPLRFLTTFPAIGALGTSEYAVKTPDLFILFDGAFWAPFTLWLLTSLFLPLGAAYFFNINRQQTTTSQSTASNTRRSSSTNQQKKTNFDPLTFNIAKALLAYIVYARGFGFWDVWSGYSVERVNAAVPGQWGGVLTGTAIGSIGAIYEAILQK